MPPEIFRLNMNPRIETAIVGLEREPLLIVDDLVEDAGSLVDYCADRAFFPAGSLIGGYPGLRTAAPESYFYPVLKALHPLLVRVFGLGTAAPKDASCTFSLATLPLDALSPVQCVPHFDSSNPMQFAVLHYLCDERFGGTAFFRHRPTGFEAITAVRETEFRARVAQELKAAAPRETYDGRGSENYEMIGACPARFNRIVVYRSRLLHALQMTDTSRLSTDPRQGRLTANIFMTYQAQT